MKKKLIDNLGLKLLALAAAVIIWLLVVSINDPVASKTFRDVPVTIQNEDVVTSEGKTYQIESGSTVNVTVRAQRSVLSQIVAGDLIVTADMKEMNLSSMIPTNVSIAGFDGRIQRATTNPVNVQVSIEDMVSNKFPISVSTTGTLRDGFALAGTEVDPQTVTISGPESVIKSIDHAEARISLSGVSSNTTIRSELTLYDADNKEIDQTRLTNNIGDAGINVAVSVYPTKEVPVTIEKDQIATASGYYLADVSYEPGTIEIAAPEDILKDISEISIPASAFDLSNVKEKKEVTLQIRDYLPEGVKIATSEDAKIVFTFNIAKYGEKKIDCPVGSIIVENLADDLQVEYAKTEDLEITVQGPQSELDKLSLSKAVSIDLSSCTKAGTYDVPVKVTLPERCSAQSLTVTVNLQKKE